MCPLRFFEGLQKRIDTSTLNNEKWMISPLVDEALGLLELDRMQENTGRAALGAGSIEGHMV